MTDVRRAIPGRVIVSIAAAVLLASCSSIYLHDTKTEELTQTTKDDLGQIKVSDYFADERLQLANFAAREDQAVAAYMIASRDRQFSRLVRDSVLGDNRQTPVERLVQLVRGRFEEIIGREPNAKLLQELEGYPAQFALAREGIEVNTAFYRQALKSFLADRDKDDSRPTDCESFPKSADVLSTAPAADIAYARLAEACADIRKTIADSNSIRQTLSPDPGSALARVIGNADTARAAIVAEEANAAGIRKLLSDIQNAPATPSAQSQLSDKIAELRKLLEGAKGIAKLAGAEGISDSLERVLAADLEAGSKNASGDGSTDAALTQEATAVLKLSDALAQASDAFAKEPRIKRVNSVLIALIEQRQKLDLAKLEISQQNDLLRIYEGEELALVQELAQLSITKRVADSHLRGTPVSGDGGGFAAVPPGPGAPGPAVGLALASYSASWNQGQIPYWVLQFKEIQVMRAYHVESAAKTAQNWQSLLAPAIEELVAYGKGGIHPEEIARLITNLGLIAAVGAI